MVGRTLQSLSFTRQSVSFGNAVPRRRSLPLLASLILFSGAALGQGRFIEDIQVSRSNGTAEILILLACPMRYQSDLRTEAGALLELRVAPFDDCRELGGGAGISSELYRPVSGRLAQLVEVEYESLGIGDSLLLLRFDGPVDYRIAQRADLRTLSVLVNLDLPPEITQAAPLPIPVSPPVEDRPPASRARPPLTSRVVEPETVTDYMINLVSTREPVDPSVAAAVATAAGQHLYVSQAEIDSDVWYRLRLGFFPSELAAETALDSLRADFPRAWIGRAEPEEIRLAPEYAIAPGQSEALAVIVAEETDVDAGPVELSAPLPAERVAALREQGRAAMLAQDYNTAIAVYAQLASTEGEQRPESIEFLGLAYQRSGRLADARAQYVRYLSEFAGSDGGPRVRQRLDGLVLAAAVPREPLRSSAVADAGGRLQLATGVSQYYRHDVNQFDEDQSEITTLSGIFSNVDFSVSRRGERVDMDARLSLSHVYDLLDEPSRSGQSRYSYAYVDLDSVPGDWSLRMGRQSLHSFGVLGRFDGAHFNYEWAPDRSVHVQAGYPVESTRDSIETDRQFYGVAVEFEELIGDWDVAAFVNAQTIESIDARKAVGTELRYFDEKRSLTGLIDYDVDFSEINTVLVLGTWRLQNRLTFSALFDDRKSPILTARNALIGQPVGTIDELLLVWTEDELRQLAIDRTSASRTLTLGIATPLGDRFQLNFDATASEIEGTSASGGVAAIAGTGQELYYSTSLVGTGLFSTGDVTILNLRFGDSERFQSTYLTWDFRLPLGRRIRINPRLRLSVWEGLLDGRRRETVNPSLRLLVNMRNHYRVEFEIGANTQDRFDLNGQTQASGNYINLGYRANF